MSLTGVGVRLCAVAMLTRAARCNVCAVQWYCISRCLCGCIPIGVCLDEGVGDPVSLKVVSVRNPETYL